MRLFCFLTCFYCTLLFTTFGDVVLCLCCFHYRFLLVYRAGEQTSVSVQDDRVAAHAATDDERHTVWSWLSPHHADRGRQKSLFPAPCTSLQRLPESLIFSAFFSIFWSGDHASQPVFLALSETGGSSTPPVKLGLQHLDYVTTFVRRKSVKWNINQYVWLFPGRQWKERFRTIFEASFDQHWMNKWFSSPPFISLVANECSGLVWS